MDRARCGSWWTSSLMGAGSLVVAAVLATVAPATAAAAVVVRRDVYSLTPAQLKVLAKGVKAMKKKPATDPTSWAYQAAIHGSDTTPAKTLWNSCQHGSYFFLSWHRMYLYYFERILRKASGDATFALPYWNYTKAAERALPPSFRTPATASNALYVAERAAGMNSGDKLPASAVSTTAAMNVKDFSSATGSGAGFGGQREAGPVHFTGPHGRIENTPHDVVHVIVGGDTGWMSDPNTAAQDPIFWLHHANIDRLWKQWLRKGAGRANPTGDSIWMTTTFSFFDEDGHEVKLTGKEVLDTASQLEYRYDDEPAAPLVAAAAPAVAAAAAKPEPMTEAENAEKKIVPATDVELGNAPVHARVAAAGGPAAGGASRLAKIAADFKAPEHIVLHLDDIQYDRSPGHFFEVYVNLPDDITDPNFQSPHYVGNLATFALKHHHAAAGGAAPAPPASQTFDITSVARALKAFDRWSDAGDVTVTLVPRGSEPAKPKTKTAAGTTASLTAKASPVVKIGRISVTAE